MFLSDVTNVLFVFGVQFPKQTSEATPALVGGATAEWRELEV